MPEAHSVVQALSGAPHAVVEALTPTALAYLLLRRGLRSPTVVICAEEARAERLVADLQGLGCDDVALLLTDEATPFEEVAADPALVFGRSALRQRLAAGARPAVLVATAAAVQGRWMPRADFVAASRTHAAGSTVQRERLAADLTFCGFQAVPFVEDEGTFAIRGGVVDVFVPGQPRPLRLDLFGDEIASIHEVDVASQRPVAARDRLDFFPIREVLFDATTAARAQATLRAVGDAHDVPSRKLRALCEQVGLHDYFYGVEALWPAFYRDPAAAAAVTAAAAAGTAGEPVLPPLLAGAGLLVLDHPDGIRMAWQQRLQRATTERERALERHQVVLDVADHLLDEEALQPLLGGSRSLHVTPLALHGEAVLPHRLGVPEGLVAELTARRADPQRGEILAPLVDLVRARRRADEPVLLMCGSRAQAERLREMLLARRLDLPMVEGIAAAAWAVPPAAAAAALPRCAIVVAAVGQSLVDGDPGAGVLWLSDVDIFAVAPHRPRRRRRRAAARDKLSSLRDLREGEPVIHQDHGIGRYLGLKRLILGGVDGDYVHLEYLGGDKLYVPVYGLAALQPYRGPSAQVRLDKLGGSRWERAKQRVKDSVLAIAHELLALQAARKTRPGHAMPAPDDAFRRFEASFPYEETEDQQRAIDEVLADLQKPTPMDRLVCGDVGFGKTEVALRGTYLTLLGGHQVAVLVPTTVLAEQHRNTFAERLAPAGAVVEVVSRFRHPKQIQDVLARLQRGAIDVLIGTHRLLSADVAFKKLGLLVVDEEQRFGVKHKERIKQMRSQVHVLTLTATPIPRTLHMASVGLRDLSIIQTPPQERTSVRTEVLRFDEAVVAEAIRRELHRGGQVFLVHNRVQSIAAMASLAARLVPEAKVVVAHGQMSADELERIMVGFVTHAANVLVCTAIIESGIDIPSANTMIINRADTFGLSQLHQLRGRIGRGRERAYAYLMLPRGEHLNKEATERLSVLKRFSELGSGFQIASHDLELRGAGDLLGADQSGSIAAVGFELYTELLAEAAERVRGEPAAAAVEPDLKLPVAAVLPENYVFEPMQRLAYYQRMAAAPADAAIFDIVSEIKEIYGELPAEVEALAEVMVIRRRLRALGALSCAAARDAANVRIGVAFAPTAAVDRQDLVQRCQAEPGRYRLLASGKLALTVPAGGDDDRALLQAVRHAIGELRLAGNPTPVGRLGEG